jgi:hypothetical protein
VQEPHRWLAGRVPALRPARAPTPPPDPLPEPVAAPAATLDRADGVAEASQASAPPSTAAASLLRYDFERGELPPDFVQGIVVSEACSAGGGRHCVLGTMSPYGAENAVVVERLKPPLFAYASDQVLRFDYRMGADSGALYVQVWAPSRKQNFAIKLADALRETWARAEVRLSDLRGLRRGDALGEGDLVSNIYIKAGRVGGGPLYVDDIELSRAPQGQLPSLSTAAHPLPPR